MCALCIRIEWKILCGGNAEGFERGNIIKSSRTVENNRVCVLFLILDTFFNSTSVL